ncbi:hypothetical protein [Psychroserpens luteus]|uniref:GRAM domain-containing protein n=1 Tax=Psychroserpens luteus TaxID=1434066 RepID=A0ABW5ZST0_9FLAO|nr:hypothetical protein [Psychroserpens luteus]
MNLLVELFKQDLKINYNQNETEIFSDGANLWKGALAVGGKLILTQERLIFIPHIFNLGLGGKDEYLNLSEIDSANRVKTLQLIDNGLKIILSNERVLKFVVNYPAKWIEHLKKSNINILKV